ncbi:MAG: 16S rRNA (adenine(1518)-N(6)/adenine(1519)-N(6))-dimethyltransferase RsmA [Clostridia bacterium]|nr:16S rRNA (adenine(1518)-N(6)/adenine(1519)-N(6))-dimethyltransferase RsmA [Clostridia bacterium]
MSNLSDIGTIKDIMQRHGFSFSKGLGQNFLINPSVCPRMAEQCGADARTGVLEIGPGIGVLTAELARRARKVAAVELDDRLLPVLDETLRDFDNVRVVHGDVMKLDLAALIAECFADCEKVAVCANLPYYITSPVIMMLLESRLPVSAITVMVQKEAADRLCAGVGSRESGAVTVAVHYYAEPELLFKVSRGSFMPSPNVDSAVIRLSVREEPAVDVGDEGVFFGMVRAGFSQRRKTLANSLTSGGFLKREEAARALADAGIPANTRIEALDMGQLANLSRNIVHLRCQ